jgi:proteic killer suppression protein
MARKPVPARYWLEAIADGSEIKRRLRLELLLNKSDRFILLRDRSVTSNVMGYNRSMIVSFKHRGLEQFFESGSTRGIQAKYVTRIRMILARLSSATSPQDMNLPGLVLHELAGQRKGTWSVKVSGNWRITFTFDGVDACNVDLEDYH